jgi:recombination protein RecR
MVIDKLINALRFLPGIGPRSAQRMAFYLLQHGREEGRELAEAINNAIKDIGSCNRCRCFSEQALCNICSNLRRDNTLLCIVETQADIIAIEQTNSYHGLYFVLTGHLSPIDGIGPKELGIDDLMNLFNPEHDIKEVIIATNPTIEGEATAHYLSRLLREKNIVCTRIAHGIPFGGELEYIDTNTLARALAGRTNIED